MFQDLQLLTSHAGSDDPEVELLVPEWDVADPELSIVIPAMNEELTIGEFVEWCKQGIAAAEIDAEILIISSSTDRTAPIALEHGARVLQTPRRGLGRAYLDAIPYVRGKYMVLGDADCTYDFRQLRPFVDRLRDGYEFVLGSRWKGSIEPGAMPALHRYVGTPVTTWVLNRLYRSHFSDIHCGMRAVTTDAFLRMDIRSQSWEYASEMIVKAVQLRLSTTEVPVHFLKDREGRLSHHRRSGWTSPWNAAWINLRAMFIYGADFFVLKPGLVLVCIGLLLTLPSTFGPLEIGSVSLVIFWPLAGSAMMILGLQGIYMGGLAQVMYDRHGQTTTRWLRMFRYSRTVLLCLGGFCIGALLTSFLVIDYISHDLALIGHEGWHGNAAITGLTLVIVSVMTFVFVLLLHALAERLTGSRPAISVRGLENTGNETPQAMQ